MLASSRSLHVVNVLLPLWGEEELLSDNFKFIIATPKPEKAGQPLIS